jgi:F-type H+-transporting ATPase subunit b
MMVSRWALGLMFASALTVCLSVWVEPSRASAPASSPPTEAVPGEAGHAPAAGGGEEKINPLNWQNDLAVWTAVVFVCLFVILWKFAWGPIARGLDKREHSVADQIAQAEAANQKAKDLLADYERRLAAASDEVRGILEQGRRDAEQVGRELVAKAKEEAKAEQERAAQRIEAATDAAVKELADRSATMAIGLAQKIVRTKLTTSDHAALIAQAVNGFVAGKPAGGNN